MRAISLFVGRIDADVGIEDSGRRDPTGRDKPTCGKSKYRNKPTSC